MLEGEFKIWVSSLLLDPVFHARLACFIDNPQTRPKWFQREGIVDSQEQNSDLRAAHAG